MLNLDNYDYDTVDASINVCGKVGSIKISSAFTPKVRKAEAIFGASIDAMEAQGISETEDFENFGVVIQVSSEFNRSIHAQLATAMIDHWPFDIDCFDFFKDNMEASVQVINASRKRAVEFHEKKNK